jgi:hypothetical protein
MAGRGFRRLPSLSLALLEERIRSLLPGLPCAARYRSFGELYPKLDWAPRLLRAKGPCGNSPAIRSKLISLLFRFAEPTFAVGCSARI